MPKATWQRNKNAQSPVRQSTSKLLYRGTLQKASNEKETSTCERRMRIVGMVQKSDLLLRTRGKIFAVTRRSRSVLRNSCAARGRQLPSQCHAARSRQQRSFI